MGGFFVRRASLAARTNGRLVPILTTFCYLEYYLNIEHMHAESEFTQNAGNDRRCRAQEEGARMNDTFKALSDPTRRQIIQLLKVRDMTAGEIADQFTISKPSISHHLNLLKQARLVRDERQGQNIVYSLNLTVIQEAMGWFLGMLGTKEKGE
jgi:DNA-binding transcriptional ArsR family regulator